MYTGGAKGEDMAGEMYIEQAHYHIHHDGRTFLAIAKAPFPDDPFIMDVFRFRSRADLEAQFGDEAETVLVGERDGGQYQSIRIVAPTLVDALNALHERLNSLDPKTFIDGVGKVDPGPLFWRNCPPPSDVYTIDPLIDGWLRRPSEYLD
jgi:hypothetical protein